MYRKKGEGLRQRWTGLTVSLKWSLCLLWTASAKCWSLGWGRRFSSSRMSRIPTSLASTRSGNSNYKCNNNSFMILASRFNSKMYKSPTSVKTNVLIPLMSQSLKYIFLTKYRYPCKRGKVGIIAAMMTQKLENHLEFMFWILFEFYFCLFFLEVNIQSTKHWDSHLAIYLNYSYAILCLQHNLVDKDLRKKKNCINKHLCINPADWGVN